MRSRQCINSLVILVLQENEDTDTTTASRLETDRLCAKIAEAKAASQTVFSDTQKLMAVAAQVTAARDSFKGEAADAQAAELRAKAAESKAQAASQHARQVAEGLQQAAATFAAERGCLESQAAITASANAEAKGASQQAQLDTQALLKATAEANAACKANDEASVAAMAAAKQTHQEIQMLHKATVAAIAARDGLAAQSSELHSVQSDIQAAVEHAQQTATKLDLDMEAAQKVLQSQAAKLRSSKADALAANTMLQVTIDLAMP